MKENLTGVEAEVCQESVKFPVRFGLGGLLEQVLDDPDLTLGFTTLKSDAPPVGMEPQKSHATHTDPGPPRLATLGRNHGDFEFGTIALHDQDPA